MYQDTNRIRNTRISISLDKYEAKLIQALVDYTGVERAALLRQMILSEAQELLLGNNTSMAASTPGSEGRNRA